jgi:hypothetical protein
MSGQQGSPQQKDPPGEGLQENSEGVQRQFLEAVDISPNSIATPTTLNTERLQQAQSTPTPNPSNPPTTEDVSGDTSLNTYIVEGLQDLQSTPTQYLRWDTEQALDPWGWGGPNSSTIQQPQPNVNEGLQLTEPNSEGVQSHVTPNASTIDLSQDTQMMEAQANDHVTATPTTPQHIPGHVTPSSF